MNISPVNFTSRSKCLKKGKIVRRHEFKAPHNNIPYPISKQHNIGTKKVNGALSHKEAGLYAEQMEEMLSSNPNNSVARMLLKEYTRMLEK